jgi:phytoene desaturase
LAKYFKSEKLRIAMTFQAKYLGMSPWECPGPFSILSYFEHAFGIHHPMGGVHKLTEAMAKAAIEDGTKINLSSEVKRILFENDKANGIELADGRTFSADAVIMNADFAQGMSRLVPESRRNSWKDKKLQQSQYSCSTFMLYLGLKKKYDFEHHNIFFAADYKNNIEEIFKDKTLPQDPSFYIQNASVTDSSLAPEGKSAIYVLVPVPNNTSGIDWPREKGKYRDLVMQKIKEKTEMTDIEDQIEVEKIITPEE